jgi:tRNA (guanine37-N1)-methyltransferase
MVRAFDLLGNIAIVNFPLDYKLSKKKKFAVQILKSNKSIKTVLEKSGKIKGRLRTPETKYLAGEKTKEVLYKENGCFFRFNVDKVYFSPRLSNDRLEVASQIKKNEKVLVMFAGAAPFSIVIAKISGAKVFSNEINRIANKYGRLNVELNKVKNKIEFWDGDIKRIAKKKDEKFDVIVMPRPQLKDSFLEQAFLFSKKSTRTFYYDFCEVGKEKDVVEKIKSEAKKFRKKIKILRVKKAGEIAPYKIRLRVDFKLV